MLFIIRMLSFILRQLWRLWLWLCFLVCLSLLCLALLFLELPTYQPSIVQWFSTTLSYPLTLGRMTTYWFGLNPTIALHDLRILNPHHQQQPLIEIGYAEVQIDLINSIKQRQLLTAHIMISQTQLALTQNRTGQIHLAGDPSQNQTEKPPRNLWGWLLLQPSFSLQADRLSWQMPQHSFVLIKPHLTLQRQATHYQVTANLPLSPHIIPIISQGLLSFTGKIDLKKERFTSLTGQITAQQLQLTVQQRLLNLPYLQGQLTVSQIRQQGWHITLQELLLKTAQQQWPNNELDFKWIAQRAGPEITAQLKFLPLELLFAEQFELPPALKILQGDLYNIQFNSYITLKNWQVKADFSKLTAQLEDSSLVEHQRTLRLQNLAGQLTMSAKNGRIHVTGGTIHVGHHALYRHPLTLQQLQGEVDWQLRSVGTSQVHRGSRQQEWRFQTQGFRAIDRDYSILLTGNVIIPISSGIPKSDLILTINGGKITQLNDYIPNNLIPSFAQWLQNALISGQLHTAKITLQGAMNELFTGKNKGFGLQATIKNVRFQYAPAWPAFDELDAEISIKNQQLKVTTQSGTLLQSGIKEIKARIDNLYSHSLLLHLEGQLQSTMADSLQFIQQSPLHHTFHLEHLALAGAIELRLKMILSLPQVQLTNLNGQILLKNTTLTERSSALTLTKMRGLINFDENSITSEKITGELFSNAIVLSFIKQFDDPLKPLSMQMTGSADNDFICQKLVHFNKKMDCSWLAHILSGETSWHALLETTEAKEGQNLHLLVKSDLIGMAINLPAPFGKTKDHALSSHLDLNFTTSGQDTLQIQYGTLLQSIFLIENKVLNRGTVWLGEVKPLQLASPPGMSIIGHLTDFSITTWHHWLTTTLAISTTTSSSYDLDLSWLGEINFSADQFEIFGQIFTKMSIRLQSPTNPLKISLQSKELEGYIIVKSSQKIPSVNIVFERLHLAIPNPPKFTTVPQEETNDFMDLRKLPALAFHCDTLKIGESDLGNVNFYTQPVETGVQIDLFEAKAAHFDLQAKGQWLYQQQRTSIELNLYSDRVGQLLWRLGYRNLPLIGRNVQVNLTAQWPGPPQAFKLATVTAALDIVMLNGQILTVEPGAVGRLFGLFDLQALPRRLLLDFRDIFNTGFSFDSISGNFAITAGRAYTENLVLQSSLAHILIQGDTDLINKNFNQKAIVIPHVSNALPVAGALAGGLSIGAVILVVQQLLQTEIEKAVHYQYIIQGSWEKPEVSLTSKQNLDEKSFSTDH